MSCPNHPEVVSGLVSCAHCGRSFCRDCVIEIGGRPYDAACKDDAVRDAKSGSDVADIASAGKRFVAMFVDQLVIGVPAAVAMILVFGGQAQSTQITVLRALVPTALFIVYEALMLSASGQTLGKRVAGIKVVTAEGDEVGSGHAWKRAFSRGLMGITYVLGIVDVLMVYSAQRRTLHDRAGATLVINSRG